eukprot:6212163-Pleurochrysis_carterae.AAC.1
MPDWTFWTVGWVDPLQFTAPRPGAWPPRSPAPPPASTPPIRASAEGYGGWGEHLSRSLARWLRHRARSRSQEYEATFLILVAHPGVLAVHSLLVLISQRGVLSSSGLSRGSDHPREHARYPD